MEIDDNYLIKISKFHSKVLPRPTIKEDRCETLEELGIITVVCELNEDV